MNRLFLQCTAFCLAVMSMNVWAVQVEKPRDPYQHFFHQTLNDFSEELELARQEGKKGLLFFFEQAECPFCHYMKNTVLNQPRVQAYYRDHFLNYAVDIEGDIEIVDFQGNTMTQKEFSFKIHRVRATPVFTFYDLQGKRMVRFIGKTTGVDEFMLLGKYVVEGIYKDMSFTKYKRQQTKKK